MKYHQVIVQFEIYGTLVRDRDTISIWRYQDKYYVNTMNSIWFEWIKKNPPDKTQSIDEYNWRHIKDVLVYKKLDELKKQ